MIRSCHLVLLSAAVVPALLTAQTVPGLTFKIRTQLRNHSVPEKSKPDSVRIRRLALAAEVRANANAGVDVGSADAPPVARPAAPTGGCQRVGGGANNVLMMNGSFVKGFGRMDVQGVIGCPELTATQVAVFTDTSSMIMDESEKVWWNRVFNIGSILDFTSAVDAQRVPIGMLKVSWDTLPSETYEGRPAKHYQLHMAYGLGQPQREDSLKTLAVTTVTSDYWVEDLPVNFENRFAGIGRPRRQIPDSLRGEWSKMLDLYAQLGKGTIVKFSATGIIGENGNSATDYTRTMEMSEIKAAPLDPGALKIPDTFTLRQPQRGRGGD